MPPPPGDTVTIWHVAGPSLSGMPSLPTAIANQMRRRGVAAVHYTTLYSDTGDSADYGRQVGAAGGPGAGAGAGGGRQAGDTARLGCHTRSGVGGRTS